MEEMRLLGRVYQRRSPVGWSAMAISSAISTAGKAAQPKTSPSNPPNSRCTEVGPRGSGINEATKKAELNNTNTTTAIPGQGVVDPLLDDHQLNVELGDQRTR